VNSHLVARLSVLVKIAGMTRTVRDLGTVDDQLHRAGRAADDASARLDRFGRIRATARAMIDIIGLGALADAKERLSAFARRRDTADARVNVAGLARLDEARLRLAAWGRARATAIANIDVRGAVARLGELGRGLGETRVSLGLFSTQLRKLPALLAVATSTVGGLVAAVIPLLSSLGAATAGFGALGVAAGATLGPVIPLAVAVVKRLKDAGTVGEHAGQEIKQAFSAMTGRGAAAVISGLAKAAAALAPVMRHLRSEFTVLGQTVGSSVGHSARVFASWQRFFAQATRTAATAAPVVTGIFLRIAAILKNIAQAAFPAFLAELRRAKAAVDAWQPHGPQQLRRTIDGLVGQFNQWVHIISNVGRGLGGMFEAVNPQAKGFAASVSQTARHFNEWSHSKQGRQAIQRFFAATLPLVHRLLDLIGQAGKALVNFGAVTAPAAAVFAHAFGAILSVINRALVAMRGLPGPVKTFLGTLLILSGPLRLVRIGIAGIRAVVGPLTAAFGLLSDAAVVTRIRLAALAVQEKVQAAAAEGTTVAMVAMRAKSLLVAAALLAQQAATAVATGATIAFGAALDVALGPIGVIIAALAALGAAIYEIVTHWDTVKRATKTVWAWIKTHLKIVIPVIAGILTGGIGAAVALIITHWKTVQAATHTVWVAISKALSVVWGAIRKAATVTWHAINVAVLTPTRAAQTVLSTVWHAIHQAARTVWQATGATAAKLWDAIKFAVLTPARAARDTAGTVWHTIHRTARTVWQAIKGTADTVWHAIKQAITGPVHNAWQAVRDVLGLGKAHGMIDGMAGAWRTIKGDVKTAWSAVHDHIVTPVSNAVDKVKGLIGLGKHPHGLIQDLGGAWTTITGAVTKFAKNLKTGIEKGVVHGLNAIIGFLDDIINVLNKLPFVSIGKIAKIKMPGGHKRSGGGEHTGKGVGHRATGGIVQRGGIVTQPAIVWGEEAPRFPEWVIPSNPAYRDRAHGLIAQAANATGMAAFAAGGVFSYGQLEKLWAEAGGAKSQAPLMAAIAEAESRGNPRAYNPSGATGLWQILGAPNRGAYWHGNTDFTNPAVNARAAVQKLHDQGLGAWQTFTDGAYKQFLHGGGGGILGSILGALSSAAGAVMSLGGKAINSVEGAVHWVLGKLPSVDTIPEWLRGIGSHVLSGIGGWVKDKVGGLFGLGGGKPGGGGLGHFDGLPVANWIIPELQWAQRHGWHGRITSGYRPPGEVVSNAQGIVAPQGHSNHNTTAYPGGAIDVGDPGARTAGQALENIIRNYPGKRRLVWGGPVIGDWGHFSATGHAMGGVVGRGVAPFTPSVLTAPYVGSYRDGGTVPQDGLAMVHRGETITSNQAGRGTVVVEGDLVVSQHEDADLVARKLAWALQS
jgi:SLT domain-containing protein